MIFLSENVAELVNLLRLELLKRKHVSGSLLSKKILTNCVLYISFLLSRNCTVRKKYIYTDTLEKIADA